MQEENKIKKAPRRVIFNISQIDHEEIKTRSWKSRLTIRDWIIQAIALKIKQEDGLQ